MRFRCALKGEAVSSLCSLITSLGKLKAETCVMVLHPRKGMEIRVCEAQDSLQVFAKIGRSKFHEFLCESPSDPDEGIGIRLHLSVLSNAIRSLFNVKSASIALSSKQATACLTIVTETPNGSRVTQDVGVLLVLQPEELLQYREPNVPEGPSAIVGLPDLEQLRSVLDHIKFDQLMQIKVYPKGILVLKAESETVAAKTVFSGLALTEEQGEDFLAARLRVKDLLLAINVAVGAKPVTKALAVVPSLCVIVNVGLTGDAHVVFYLPVLLDQYDG